MTGRFYYGWLITASLFLVLLVHGGAGFYVFAIFYDPLMAEFGWARADVAAGIAIYISAIALSAPFVGGITDRCGARRVLAAGGVFGGLSFLMLSQVHALWQFYLLYLLLGLSLGSACGPLPSASLISRWFVERRGLAMGVSTAGISLGALLLVVAGGLILNESGWRSAYVFFGVLTWVVVLPPVVFLVKDKPQDIGLEPPGWVGSKDADSRKIALSDLLGAGSFWLLTAAFLFVFMSLSAILQHQVNYFIEIGVDPLAAASVLGLTGGMGGVGKVLFGHIADRTDPEKAILLSFAVQMLGIVLLLSFRGSYMMWCFAAVYGVSMGAQLALKPLLVGRFFGLESFGTTLGLLTVAGAAGTAAGPVVAAVVRDAGVGYPVIFSGCILLVALSGIAILLASRYRRMEPRSGPVSPGTA